MKKGLKKLAISALLVLSGFMLQPAHAQSEPFLGQMMLFGGNFCPRGWVEADGGLYEISQNNALFSILGTIYGGDGRTTYAVPDLRGRVPIGQGNGPGLSSYQEGQKGGAENTTLNITNLPSHNHIATATSTALIKAADDGPNTSGSSEAALTQSQIYNNEEGPAPIVDGVGAATLHEDSVDVTTSVTVGNTGSNIPFNNLSPYLGMRWCIATIGVFPSRSSEALPNE